MRLAALLPDDTAGASGDVEIAGLAFDSRKVGKGFLFFAIAGAKADGAHFAKQAASAGAVAIAAEKPVGDLPAGVAFIQVKNVRRALALAAAKFYPRQPATIAASSSGVWPWASRASTGAPRSSSQVTISALCFLAATCSGVVP